LAGRIGDDRFFHPGRAIDQAFSQTSQAWPEAVRAGTPLMGSCRLLIKCTVTVILESEPEADMFERLRAAESVGRPLGDDRFFTRAERLTKRSLKPAKRGPKPSESESR